MMPLGSPAAAELVTEAADYPLGLLEGRRFYRA
jgi:hypothetical protein